MFSLIIVLFYNLYNFYTYVCNNILIISWTSIILLSINQCERIVTKDINLHGTITIELLIITLFFSVTILKKYKFITYFNLMVEAFVTYFSYFGLVNYLTLLYSISLYYTGLMHID